MRLSAVLLLPVLLALPASALEPYLVNDVNQSHSPGSSFPSAFVTLGEAALFGALEPDTGFELWTSDFGDDGVRGFELWKSDGTEAGTSLVAELTAGEAPYGPPARPPAAELGGALFFIQNRTPNDAWLMRTDGTAAGTFRVTPEGVDCCFPALAAAGGRLFFTARDEDHGLELWATDGTAAGTHRVADLVPGSAGSFPRELTILDGALWFMAADEDGNRWLWQSDGTEAGTVRVADLGVFHLSALSLLTAHAGRLWFFASDGEQGLVLWVSDGTAAGTAPAVDLAPGAAGFLPALLVSLGEKLVVSGSVDGGPDGLWATDGTPESTERIGDAWYSGSAWTVFQGRLFYSPYSRFGPVPGLM